MPPKADEGLLLVADLRWMLLERDNPTQGGISMRRFSFIASMALAASLAMQSAAQGEELWEQLPEPPPMPEASESGSAPVNGIEMYYAIYGSGEPLILLHGGLGHSDVWGNQIPVFAKQYKVIVVDSRGHGRSTRTSEPYSYRLMASDVVALMDH